MNWKRGEPFWVSAFIFAPLVGGVLAVWWNSFFYFDMNATVIVGGASFGALVVLLSNGLMFGLHNAMFPEVKKK